MRSDIKTRALLEAIHDFEWHTVANEPESLLLEGKLIKEFRPRYNISFRDDKRFLLVKVDPCDDWPRFRLTRVNANDGARYFGPFANAGALRQTLAFLRKQFGVLTFGRGSPTERELRSSTYQVPMKLADTTPEEYRERIDRASDFLEGRSKEALDELEQEMRKAAERLDFERAAELRNMLDDLRQTTKPMRRFTREMGHRLKLPSLVNPENDLVELGEALAMQRPPHRMECFDISNISSTHIVASMVCFLGGTAAKAEYRRYRIKSVEGQDDFASMAEVVRRRYARVLLEAAAQEPGAAEFSQEYPADAMERLAKSECVSVRLPDLIIVDGGKGQLSSACRELQALGLGGVPVIGLAKEFEEIYRPGHAEPLLLPRESGGLRLLQRIRDEAHRFANGYHQLLMKRRVAESLLDDCPGVSASRKQALLQRFGSVKRIRAAGATDLALVPGIGPKLAEQIVRYLAERH
jgi:excinuclease ABC subunit C